VSEETYLELDDGPRLPMPVGDVGAVHHDLAFAECSEGELDRAKELQVGESG